MKTRTHRAGSLAIRFKGIPDPVLRRPVSAVSREIVQRFSMGLSSAAHARVAALLVTSTHVELCGRIPSASRGFVVPMQVVGHKATEADVARAMQDTHCLRTLEDLIDAISCDDTVEARYLGSLIAGKVFLAGS